MAVDHAAHKNIVLLARSGKYDVETWTWDGQTWTRQHPSAVPPATVDYRMEIWTGSNWERKT